MINIRKQSDETGWKVKKITLISLLVNLALFIVKLLGGIAGNSQAVVADAIHSLSDLSTDFAVFFGYKFWSKSPDDDHPYGHGRIEAIITLFISVLLLFVAIGIGRGALEMVLGKHEHQTGWIAFWVALISVISKEILYKYTLIVGKKIRSSAVVANAWHHRTDAFSSIPVAIAVAASAVKPSLSILDPIAALLVSVFIVIAAWKIAKPAFKEIIDTGLPDSISRDIAAMAGKVDGVIDAHDIRTRRIGSNYFLDMHIEVRGNISVRDGHDIAEDVRMMIEEKYEDIIDVLIHIDPGE